MGATHYILENKDKNQLNPTSKGPIVRVSGDFED